MELRGLGCNALLTLGLENVIQILKKSFRLSSESLVIYATILYINIWFKLLFLYIHAHIIIQTKHFIIMHENECFTSYSFNISDSSSMKSIHLNRVTEVFGDMPFFSYFYSYRAISMLLWLTG